MQMEKYKLNVMEDKRMKKLKIYSMVLAIALMFVSVNPAVVSAGTIDIAEEIGEYTQTIQAGTWRESPDEYYPYDDGSLVVKIYNDNYERNLTVKLYDNYTHRYVQRYEATNWRNVLTFDGLSMSHTYSIDIWNNGNSSATVEVMVL